MYIKASAPDAPPLSDTTIGCFIRLFFWIAACIIRAIWSEAPPAPAATTISTGFVGSQPATAGILASMAASATAHFMIFRTPPTPFRSLHSPAPPKHGLLASLYRDFKRDRAPAHYDFRIGWRCFAVTPVVWKMMG